MGVVAVIGSFKQHYDAALEARQAFLDAGHEVTTPLGADVVEQRDFVRFRSDDAEWTDARVQTIALHRILRADVVYVCAPSGYVGRTTCYEIGRVVQAGRPIYFSEVPRDLPISVSPSHVGPAGHVAALLTSGEVCALFDGESLTEELERRLVIGDYVDE